MRAIAIEPTASISALLPGASFADAFAIDIDDPGLDADAAARRVMGSVPGWVRYLLVLRDAVVRPFGLKGTDAVSKTASDRIGFFPCISCSPERVVMGFDDTHLDFRVVVDLSKIDGASQRVTASTVVKPHNIFGRVYLTVVMPFHRRIVPAMLARVVQ